MLTKPAMCRWACRDHRISRRLGRSGVTGVSAEDCLRERSDACMDAGGRAKQEPEPTEFRRPPVTERSPAGVGEHGRPTGTSQASTLTHWSQTPLPAIIRPNSKLSQS